MPARNVSETIAVAVESILRQTYRDLELIIVDDNSTDNTAEIAREYAKADGRVRVCALPCDDPQRIGWNGININAGWTARNFGMEQARGEWITFQDSDDASLLNRICVQHDFAVKYGSSHVCVDCQKYSPQYLGKHLDVEWIRTVHGEESLVIEPTEIVALARRSRGFIPRHFRWLHQSVPHRIRIRRIARDLFFGDMHTHYPGAGNCPLVRAAVARKVGFRPLSQRVWPSRRGRGADRDFNFAVADDVGDNISVRLPLYLWRHNGPDHPAYTSEEYQPVSGAVA
jgi:glycosyltransferase involved in cell wall biosynthesis|tara:strand:+ start:353 stop:1207 length:855 start_codon:yes stop_codon:yes gene_type:complete